MNTDNLQFELCERCDEPLDPDSNRKPGLCIDCTADDFDGHCEECGEEVEGHNARMDGLCQECWDLFGRHQNSITRGTNDE